MRAVFEAPTIAQLAPRIGEDAARRESLVVGERLSLEFRGSLEGEVRPVLWEGQRPVAEQTLWRGHTDSYVPVYAPGENLNNRVTPVTIGAVYHDGVLGSPLEGRE